MWLLFGFILLAFLIGLIVLYVCKEIKENQAEVRKLEFLINNRAPTRNQEKPLTSLQEILEFLEDIEKQDRVK